MGRDATRLRDVLNAAEDVMEFAAACSVEDFIRQKTTRYAILHALTVIGEAANQVSVEFRSSHPEVPWRRIIDFRHRLVHGYAELDYVLVWEVVTRMVPELRDQVAEMLRQVE